MEKRKPWQYFVIVAVLALTVYNILPTIFYYSQPLKSVVNEERAMGVAEDMVVRVNRMEREAVNWVRAYCKHLGIKPTSIAIDKEYPAWINVTFSDTQDARLLSSLLPRAGNLISFVPAQLDLGPEVDDDPKTVIVERRIGTRIATTDLDRYFNYSLRTSEGKPTELYKQVAADRVAEIAIAAAGITRTARQGQVILEVDDRSVEPAAIDLAGELVDLTKTFGEDSPIAQRHLSALGQGLGTNNANAVQNLAARLDRIRTNTSKQLEALHAQQKKIQDEGGFLELAQQRRLEQLEEQVQILEQGALLIRKYSNHIASAPTPLTRDEIAKQLLNSTSGAERLSLGNRNPYISEILVDWTDGSVALTLHNDINALRESKQATELQAFLRDKVNNLVANEMARITRRTGEEVKPEGDDFQLSLHTLINTRSLITLDLSELAADRAQQLEKMLATSWQPSHSELQAEIYPVLDYLSHKGRPAHEQKLGLVVYAPSIASETPPEGFRSSSIYVVARGLGTILNKYERFPDSEETQQLVADVQDLQQLMASNGFISYPGARYGIDPQFNADLIFELSDYYSNFLTATREDFIVRGSRKYAQLDLTDVEQRILATNKIEDAIHEDLLQWKEDYGTAQVDLNPLSKFNVPPPTRNVYWDNFLLTMRKYARGDDRKILRWGLDLSGGKSVRIGLRDQNNQVVTDPSDINTAVNELYTRINKMGVAERNIRVENNNIILEFPGSQGLSASELVKASAMYFHIVNEQFSVDTPDIGDTVNTFLQEVWNEAIVTNRRDLDSINEIAWRHLGGDSEGIARPRSEAAQALHEAGLAFAAPNTPKNNTFDDSLSMIARLRGDDYGEWRGQTHPLMIVFHNYALEGASLVDINVGYDPKEGNMLTFGVARSYPDKRTGSPREDFYAWTAEFAQDRISGTPKEKVSRGNGWRMAVILNDEVVTWPHLKAALRDGGTISGRFTQREVSRLASDLKAGSLTFTPRIMSEHNISPELGREERNKGIMAAGVGLALVLCFMVYTYRFAGVVASCAVLLNLLIMWGVLQNLDAALSLPGIAALVLTIGMSVDANVLVFERTREELKISGRIASALHAGYRKAFSAIIDSNLTTIIAALILIQFDSGPIKGFATTLIIGIISSMFTSLFATRFYFAGWVQKAKGKTLTMKQLIGETKFDFLAWARPAAIGAIVFIAAGGGLLFTQGQNILGMDFTGGYSLSVDLDEHDGRNYRADATQALLDAGLHSTDFQVQELSRPNELRIQLAVQLEEAGRPFYEMPKELAGRHFEFPYQRNPRLVWILDALNNADLHVQEWQREKLDASWTEMSGQLSDAMRNNALKAMAAALIAILLYITFRFEFKYGVGAVVALAHDVLITLAAMAMFYAMGWPVQIDLQVIGAIMTIIGYSLNDTIIVFDRIREDVRIMKKASLPEVINHALNVTLSRTLMTSGTTLLVLMALVLFGGTSIFTFSLVMTVGVLFGTLSSLFISAPVMLYFHNKEVARQEKLLRLKHA